MLRTVRIGCLTGVGCLVIGGIALFAFRLPAQAPSKIGFGRDVQPLFRTYCYGCHGPAVQSSNFRLDRRRDSLPNRVGANGARVVPGNAAASRLYLRIIGQAGLQMPPTGALSSEQIGIIKAGGRSWRLGMSIVVSTEPRIRDVLIADDLITARLTDGRTISVPLSWSWRLSEATAEQRAKFEILGSGQGVRWPEIDEDISVEGMLAGVPARRPPRA